MAYRKRKTVCAQTLSKASARKPPRPPTSATTPTSAHPIKNNFIKIFILVRIMLSLSSVIQRGDEYDLLCGLIDIVAPFEGIHEKKTLSHAQTHTH